MRRFWKQRQPQQPTPLDIRPGYPLLLSVSGGPLQVIVTRWNVTRSKDGVITGSIEYQDRESYIKERTFR